MSEAMDGVMTIAGPSGGAGRSSLTLTMGALLAEAGSEVLLVELDPRGCLSALAGLDVRTQKGGILEALVPGRDPNTATVATRWPGLSLMSARINTASEQLQLETALADWKALPRLLAPLREWYHTILIDVPAGMERSARAAMGASDEVLVVLQADPLAVRALPTLIQTLVDVRQSRLPRPELSGIVLNRVDVNAPFFRSVVETLCRDFAPLMLDAAIPQDSWFVEAAARAMPLPYLMPEAPGVIAVRRMMEELGRRITGVSAA